MSIAVRRGAPPRRRPSQGERFARSGDNGGAWRGSLRDVSLDDKYVLEDGRILLTGLQGLVRLPLDQHRADSRRGLHTGTMISGYQGSPLGGLDKELARNRELVEQHHVRHVPGLNEELGATSAWGSQLASQLPGAKYDGVLAMWYGKAPGLDRAADSLRHGNFVGVSRTGGGLAIVGDDPGCKSSTIPSASEALLASLQMPVFFPGNVQEVLDLGLHALACSRASGLWSGFKIVTSVADALGTATVAPERVMPVMPTVEWNGKPYEHVPNSNLLAPASLDMERTLFGPRTELALAYARENGLNRIEGAQRAWLGIVVPGKTYYDLMHALRELGLDGSGLERAGIRILKLGMISPLEPQIAREFARGLDEVLVAEEKGPFVETLLKDALYGMADAPRILGKRDERGEPLLPRELDLDADLIGRALAARLEARGVRIDSVEARLRKLAEIHGRPAELPMAQRTPFFCSGCPHNSSVKAPEGTLVGGGIGCHTMVLLNPEGKGDITGITQMGGEGAQWIGMAPFTDDSHLVQNLGDGTFHHSGSLAVRAAVAAGVNITYKLLYNEHVAMTGGQDIEGQLSVPDLTRWLELEGVRRIIVTTEDTSRYRGVELASIAELRDRKELLSSQQELADVEGVTVLIHDQECAAELRRKRKRGKAPEPAERIWINERVCEGCGDCGEKSNCLSVLPVETEFGRKTQIHQASCNKDRTCLDGDCPSFLTVVPGEKAKHRTPDARHRAARAAAAGGRRGLRRAHDGHRRHRRGDREPDARHGGAARRPARVGPRPDGPLAEGRPGDLGPAHHARAAGRREQDAGRQRGPLPRLRPARSREREEPSHCRPRAHGGGRVDQCRADRPHGDRRGRALPRASAAARQDRRGHAQRAQPLPGRPAALGAALRRPHDDQHARPRRGVPARPAAGVGRGARAGDRAERRGGREEPRGVALGTRRGRRAGRRRGGHAAAGGC